MNYLTSADVTVSGAALFAAVPGVYPVDFTVTADLDVSVTVNFVVVEGNVIDKNKEYVLAATTPQIFTTTQAAAFIADSATPNKFYTKAGVNGYELSTGAILSASDVDVSGDNVFSVTPGTYPVTFAVIDDPTVSVIVNFVVVEGTVTGGDPEYVIAAKTPQVFTVTQAAAFIDNNTSNKFYNKAGVNGYSLSPAAILIANDIDVSGDTSFLATPGVYPVTFTVKGDPDVAVTVHFVVIEGNVIDENPEYVLAANTPQIFTTTQAAAFIADSTTPNKFYAKAGVNGYELSTGAILSASDVNVSGDGSFDDNPGVYAVTFAVAADTSVAVEVDFVVVDGNVTDGDPSYVIAAKTPQIFTTTQAAAFIGDTAQNKFYTKAGVNAYNLSTGAILSASDVDVSGDGSFDDNPGVYAVTFAVAADPDVSVNVDFIVVAGNVIDEDPDYVLAAETPQVFTEAQAAAFLLESNTNKFYDKAGVNGYELNGPTALVAGDVTVAGDGSFVATPGVYPVTFTVTADQNVSVKVDFVVADGNVIDKNPNYVIAADTPQVFTTTQAAAFIADTTPDKFYGEAGVNAYNLSTGAILTASDVSVSGNASFAAAPGVYPVTFAVAADTSVAVKVNFVVIEGNVIDENPEYVIAAETPQIFTTTQAAAFLSNTSTNKFYDKAGVNGYELSVPAALGAGDVTVSGSGQFAAAPGTYPVTFAVTADSTVSVTVDFVVLPGNVIIGNPDYVLAASTPVYLTVAQAAAFLSGGANYYAAAGVSGYDLTGQTAVALTSADVTRTGTLAATAGVYPVNFAVTNDPLINVDVEFIVYNTVAYNANGGTGSVPTDATRYTGGTATVKFSPLPTRTGYTFLGWSQSSSAASPSYIAAGLKAFTVTGNTTLYAVWKINTHTVTYYGNGNTSGSDPAATTHNYGTNAVVKGSETLARAGHTFLGWAQSSNATAATFAPGATFLVSGNVSFYAVWRANQAPPVAPVTYTVTYHGNGNTSGSDPAATTHNSGTNATVKGRETLARTDYTFAGWSASSTAAAATYAAGATLTVTGNVDLYAVWTKNAEPVVEVEEPEEPKADDVTETTETPRYEGFSAEDEAKLDAQTGNLITDLVNGNVPLGNGSTGAVWSLLSLLMSAVAVLISLLLIIGAALRRRRGEDEKQSNSGMLLILSCAAGFLTLIVWLILDDFSSPMAWINKWTIIVGLILLVHVALAAVYKVRSGAHGKDARDENKVA
jgi:uncharacterized repeat protein (TIGR02543 family)